MTRSLLVFLNVVTSPGGNAKNGDERRTTSYIKQASRVIGHKLVVFVEIYTMEISMKLDGIMKDTCHPLHSIFTDAIAPRCGRMLYPLANTNRNNSSFVIVAMKMYNNTHKR